jgi:hypothetical protein
LHPSFNPMVRRSLPRLAENERNEEVTVAALVREFGDYNNIEFKSVNCTHQRPSGYQCLPVQLDSTHSCRTLSWALC